LLKPGAAVALLLVLLVGLAGTASGRPSTSGLRGVVRRGPITPVCVAGIPCSAPAAAVTLVFSRRARVSASARTAVDGTFRVALAPGYYAVRVAKSAPGRPLQPATVSVEAGRFKRVAFFLDTGIR
jgi:hypothetical protein